MKKQEIRAIVQNLKEQGVKVYLSEMGRAEVEQGGTVIDMLRISIAENKKKRR